jgi:hypothetical protein
MVRGTKGRCRLARDVAVVLAGAATAAALLAWYYASLVAGALPLPPAWAPGAPDEPVVRHALRGVRLPRVRAAADANLADDAEVIGICAGGQARAYFTGVMGTLPTRHVVNDLVGGRAVSVTYCDRTSCSRAYSGGAVNTPLDIGVAAWSERGLVLRVEHADYLQATGESVDTPGGAGLPYQETPCEQTTWKAWRDAHPDTDVYVGDSPEGEVGVPGMFPQAAP